MKSALRFFIILSSGLFISLLLFSCSNLKKEIIGTWENENRYVQFSDTEFVILNRMISDNSEFVGFSGIYEFSKNPKNVIKMKYQYAIRNDRSLLDLSGTEYEDYIDIVSLRIRNEQLQMYIAKNGKFYTYTRLKVPLQSSSE